MAAYTPGPVDGYAPSTEDMHSLVAELRAAGDAAQQTRAALPAGCSR